ncbi:MAG: DUF58 domain-containing protein [Methanobacteriota archaeon]
MNLTKKGAALLGSSLALAALALVLASPPLAAAAAVAVAMVVSAALLVPRIMSGARIEIGGDRVFEGSDLDVRVAAANPGSRRVLAELSLRLPERFVVEEGAASRPVELRPRSENAFALRCLCPRKGRYEVGPVDLVASDPFAAAFSVTTSGTPTEVWVYPAMEELSETPARSKLPKAFLGTHLVRQPGQGSSFFGLRNYQFGDALREVNWKASSRSAKKELIVTQREKESYAEVAILLDARAVAGAGPPLATPFLMGARAVASLLSHFRDQNDRVRFLSFHETWDHFPPASGDRQQYTILAHLAQLEAHGAIPFATVADFLLPQLPPRSPLFLVSPLAGDPTLPRALSLLAAHGSQVVVVAPELSAGPSGDPWAPLVRFEHELSAGQIRAMSIPVIHWPSDGRLEQVLARGF